MSDLKDLSLRIDNLEKQSASRVRFLLQYVLSPALLLLIGFFFNSKLEATKQSFQLLELEVKRIESTQGFLKELFSGTPQRAFVAERLICQIIEEKLATEISAIVKDYYDGKIENSISREDLREVEEIKVAAEKIRSPASVKLIETLRQPSYHVAVDSTSSEQDAVQKAKEFRAKGYKSEVILTNTGLYAVTLGRYSFDEANRVKKKAIGTGEAPSDAYLISHRRVVETVFPQ